MEANLATQTDMDSCFLCDLLHRAPHCESNHCGCVPLESQKEKSSETWTEGNQRYIMALSQYVCIYYFTIKFGSTCLYNSTPCSSVRHVYNCIGILSEQALKLLVLKLCNHAKSLNNYTVEPEIKS